MPKRFEVETINYIIYCPLLIVKNREHWTAYTPAKLNLFFEVLGKRPDGFHEIVSVALPVRLFDTLTFQTAAQNTIKLTVHGGGTDVPNDETNIAVKALHELRERVGISKGAVIQLFKKIPSQAGLGGGSSNAAAVLLLARRAWNLKLSDEELLGIAAQIGSDCPLFFYDTATLSTGRGETIQPLKAENIVTCPLRKRLHFAVFKPEEGLSTAEVYKNCMPNHDGKIRSVEKMLTEWNSGDLERMGKALFNRLEVPARAVWHRFDEVRTLFEDLDCLAVRMSGSGTAFYGLCRSERHAKFVVQQLRGRVKGNEHVFAVKSL